jgi:biopolymer transport protein ExbB
MFEIFLKGGPIMWPLLIVSVAALATTIERLVFLIQQHRSRSLVDRRSLQALVAASQYQEAIQLGDRSSDPAVRVVSEGLRGSAGGFETAVSCFAEAELDRYDHWVPVLDTSVTLAPLLGLLGTVTGMMSSFSILGNSQLDSPLAITGGIAEALIATAFGLGIAITALIPLNYIRARKDRLARDIEDLASRVEIQINQRSTSFATSELKRVA